MQKQYIPNVCGMFASVRRFVLIALAFVGMTLAAVVEPCKVKVVDDENGWLVPLVFLTTTHGLVYVTDNAGVRFVPRPGGEHVVKVTRHQIANRLGRVGGGGLFAESQKCGEHLTAHESDEFGRDSVQTALCHGRVFWLWGDTNKQGYPLGWLNVTAATTSAPALTRLEPPVDPPYRAFTSDNGLLFEVTYTASFANRPPRIPRWEYTQVLYRLDLDNPRLAESMNISRHERAETFLE